MHRLTKTCLGFSILVLMTGALGCGGKKKAESPSDEDKTTTSTKTDEVPSADEGGGGGDAGAPKKESCAGFDIGNLEDVLAKSECEVPNAKPDGLPPMDPKGKLEVTVTASPTKTTPGGKVDLLVTFANKSKDPLPLQFRIDPVARFDTETYDKKAKRADMPKGNPPPPPKDYTPPPPAEAKVGKVMIAPAGSARVRIPWEAVKMKWAPEKVRGSNPARGYPRAAAGPLAKGKYTVKVLTPLVGVNEGGEHEVTAPKVEIEVAP